MKYLLFLLCGFLAHTAQSQTPSGALRPATPPRKTISLPGGKAPAIPAGPFKPDWESIRKNYVVPQWFTEGKFGIFLHWGVYSVPAYASEWYSRHMYSNPGVMKYHQERFGPQAKFGYKDFIPMLKAEKYNPDEWAELFRKSGAKYVFPTAEHHDGFAMYDSRLTKWDAKDMGPKRDLLGDLAVAVRKQGLKFGVSNHRIEHWDFMYPADGLQSDIFDPAYADFYGPPQPHPTRAAAGNNREVLQDQTSAPQSKAFLEEWLARAEEMVDKFQPDVMYFDNGINTRKLDSIKLRFAAYYYNRAAEWKKQVSIITKSDAFLAGSILDYERQGNAPFQLTDYVWQTDDPLGDKFGYVEGMGLTNPESVIKRLVQDVSRNGNYVLNISPKADGTIPDDQKAILLEIGKWMDLNGEAIYGTKPYSRDSDGTVHFTVKGNTLYALSLQWPESPLIITCLPANIGRAATVTMLGVNEKISFKQNDQGMIINFPGQKPCNYAYVLKIEGLNLAPRSRN